MEVRLNSLSVGDKHYVSGTAYTPDGVVQYNGILDNFEKLYFIFPTYATIIDCYYDEVCRDNRTSESYYLIYRDESELERMLGFMDGASSKYINLIPSHIIKKLDIHIVADQIRIGGVNLPQNFDCKVIGSSFVTLTVTDDYVIFNGVKIAERDKAQDDPVCANIFRFDKELPGFAGLVVSCYYLKYYKGNPTWSEVLKTWCGIKKLLQT
jgi:hypothetical protein